MKCTHRPIISSILASRALIHAIERDIFYLDIKRISINVFGAWERIAYVDSEYINKFSFSTKEKIDLYDEKSEEGEFYSKLIPKCHNCLIEYIRIKDNNTEKYNSLIQNLENGTELTTAIKRKDTEALSVDLILSFTNNTYLLNSENEGEKSFEILKELDVFLNILGTSLEEFFPK